MKNNGYFIIGKDSDCFPPYKTEQEFIEARKSFTWERCPDRASRIISLKDAIREWNINGFNVIYGKEI